MRPTRLLYFAYGSNMSLKRIEERLGTCTKVRIIQPANPTLGYRLDGWKFEFNVSQGWSAVCNITETNVDTDYTYGVLYELTEKQIAMLDRCEGYPFVYEKRYFQVDPQTIIYAYICVNEHCLINPKPKFWSSHRASEIYMSYLIQGCIENNLFGTLAKLREYEVIFKQPKEEPPKKKGIGKKTKKIENYASNKNAINRVNPRKQRTFHESPSKNEEERKPSNGVQVNETNRSGINGLIDRLR